VLKAARWPVAIGETPSSRQEAVATGIRLCLLFLEVSVLYLEKTTRHQKI